MMHYRIGHVSFQPVVTQLPRLRFRFGIEAFRVKSKAHKAGRIFGWELGRHGRDDTITHRLTECYLEGSDRFKLLRALR